MKTENVEKRGKSLSKTTRYRFQHFGTSGSRKFFTKKVIWY